MKVLILVTAFNVENFIEKVILRLPDKLKKSQLDFEILIIDDASNDNTLKEIISIRDKYKDYNITCLSNKVNLGYGGNQKIGYHYAIKNNFDYVILLHGDGQYAPEKILDMLDPLINNNADAVQGSRMIIESFGASRRARLAATTSVTWQLHDCCYRSAARRSLVESSD